MTCATERDSSTSSAKGYIPANSSFVPRSADAREGDGWLVGLFVDSAAGRSELVVLDALASEGEPVALVLPPHRAAALTGDRVREALTSKLSRFKLPKIVEFASGSAARGFG